MAVSWVRLSRPSLRYVREGPPNIGRCRRVPISNRKDHGEQRSTPSPFRSLPLQCPRRPRSALNPSHFPSTAHMAFRHSSRLSMFAWFPLRQSVQAECRLQPFISASSNRCFGLQGLPHTVLRYASGITWTDCLPVKLPIVCMQRHWPEITFSHGQKLEHETTWNYFSGRPSLAWLPGARELLACHRTKGGFITTTIGRAVTGSITASRMALTRHYP
ncbi:hypothetical protein LY76DRAFT_62823 [Colletotrichum caudatum]|nr:hypothetical protein LY76DRAFT_62823 [Colletotrichum caudatum]